MEETMTQETKPNYTPEQKEAIYHTGHDILVSASAGSGKTMVLVERILNLVSQGADITDLLVVTFTKAAAQEMKERIQAKIQDQINQAPAGSDLKKHLIKQLPLINQANISTIHSFCSKVIQKYYYLIDMDPVFRMLTDQTEIDLVQERILDDCINLKLEDQNPSFYRLLEMFAGPSNLDPFKDMVRSIYQFALARPDSIKWLSELSQTYQVDDLKDLAIYQDEIKGDIRSSIDLAMDHYDQILNLVQGEAGLEKFQDKFGEVRQKLVSFQDLIQADRLDDFYLQGQAMKFPRKPTLPKDYKEDPHYQALDEEVKALNKSGKEAFNSLIDDYFTIKPSDQVDMINKLRPLVESLVEFLLDFHQAFSAEKEKMRVLDFNDLEHKTLDILSHESGVAQAYYQDLFQEILIDEYQDINVLQEAILSSLAKPGAGNRFMVGDVKQSIYGFRLAEPKLFIDKYDRFGQDPVKERIILQENFRSRNTVLDFINYIFHQIMDRDLGDVVYDQAAQLNVGKQDFPNEKEDLESKQTEFLLYQSKEVDTDREGELSLQDGIRESSQGQYRMVAQKIKDLVDSGFLIYDKKAGQNRPLQYRDIAILTPTKNNNLVISEEFKTLGIPVAINNTENYFQRTEIKTMMSILKIIDNPLQDIPLVAVLRSMVLGLTEPELAKIRLINRQGLYFHALEDYSKAKSDKVDPNLQAKVQGFLSQLEEWRDYAKFNSLVDLIWKIYQDTNYLEYVAGLQSGQQRQNNLHALYERAGAYEASSFKGLFQFIKFIEVMQKKDKDLAEPVSVTEDEDAVRVMTIHASKGLEFPIVFLTDSSKKFNVSDAQGDFAVDSYQGLGLNYIDTDHQIKYPTWLNKGIQAKRMRQLISEQMRVLYVALTRAEQKLFITGIGKTRDDLLKKWKTVQGQTSPILSIKERLKPDDGFLNWLGKGIIRHPLSQDLRDQKDSPVLAFQDISFQIHFYNEGDLVKSTSNPDQGPGEGDSLDVYTQTAKLNPSQDWGQEEGELKQELDQAKAYLSYHYPHQLAVNTTSYQSVSEIKRFFEVDEGLEKMDFTGQTSKPNRYVSQDLADPQFIQKGSQVKPAPKDIGSATHLVLQKCDLSQPVTAQSIQAVIDQLLDREVIDQNLANYIDQDSLVKLFTGEFGRFLQDHASQVKREQPFSLLLEAGDLFHLDTQEEDSVLIHGVIDGFVQVGKEITLFDYKTDQLGHYQDPDQVLRDRYKGQIALYKRALETIYPDSRVSHAYLVSTDLNRAIEV